MATILVAAPQLPTDAPAPRDEFLAVAADQRGGWNPYVGTAALVAARERLAAPDLPTDDRLDALLQLSAAELREGLNASAAAHADEAAAIVELERASGHPAPRHAEALARQALAYLRLAEERNCVARHTAQSCLFPIAGAGVHANKRPARQARRSLERLLALRPENLGARWLLNVAAMTSGDYPKGVAPALRIGPAAFASEADLGRFPDVAPALGVNAFSLAGGVAVEDFDGDGFLDIATSTSHPEKSLALYRNDGEGGFEERTGGSGLDDQLGGLNLIAGDFDDDGDPDLLVLRGGWQFDDGRVRKSLLRNDGELKFVDVTRQAGLAEPAYPTQAATWGDFDNDGDLDLYVVNERSGSPTSPGPAFPAQLFRNNGDGTFTDIAQAAGVTNGLQAKGVTAGDYDNDGDLDLYVSNIGPNRLYRNDGDGTFTDLAPILGVAEPVGRSFAPWFFDHDNDGDLDLWVAAYDATIDDLAAHYLGQHDRATRPRLYRNDGAGGFQDAAAKLGLDRPLLPMGANFGDLDNDGWLDVYLGTGDPELVSLMPNVMLWNDRGRAFRDVTTSGGFGHLQKGHGIAFADLDNDGDQDIYHQVGGFYPSDAFGNALFENPGHGRHFLLLRLVGTTSNRAAVGARIRVVVATPAGPREIHRAVGAVSSFGGSPTLRQEIGLGDATAINEVSIWWPRSATRQTFRDLPLDAWLEIREGATEPRRLALRPAPFSGRAARR